MLQSVVSRLSAVVTLLTVSLCIAVSASGPQKWPFSLKSSSVHEDASLPGYQLVLSSPVDVPHSSIARSLAKGRASSRDAKDAQICDKDVAQHYGYLTTPVGKAFFFWMFESRNKPSTDPLLIFMNGGPGCSSLYGLFNELGPCFIGMDNQTAHINPFAWNNNANILFVDQPIGTGFSTYVPMSNNSNPIPRAVDSKEAAADFDSLLQMLFQKFPQYAKLPLVAAGESYAGHYLTALATYIVEQNAIRAKTPTNGTTVVNLQSIVIGNGIVDPLTQYKSYPQMACNSPYPPILTDAQCKDMANVYENKCAPLIKDCYDNPTNSKTCSQATILCNNLMFDGYDLGNVSVYDVRQPPVIDPYRGDFEQYLRKQDVRKTLGVTADYQQCDYDVYSAFTHSGDWMMPYHRNVPPLLAKGIRVLIYAGNADYICNSIGNKDWVFALDWPGKSGLNNAQKKTWTVNGRTAGESWEYQNFSFVTIFEAGHMAPQQQPEASLALIEQWILNNKTVNGAYTVKGYKGLSMKDAASSPVTPGGSSSGGSSQAPGSSASSVTSTVSTILTLFIAVASFIAMLS